MSVNIEDLVAEIEDDVTKGVVDAKAVIPLIQKALQVLELAEPLVPQAAPVVTVVSKVLNVVTEVLAKV